MPSALPTLLFLIIYLRGATGITLIYLLSFKIPVLIDEPLNQYPFIYPGLEDIWT